MEGILCEFETESKCFADVCYHDYSCGAKKGTKTNYINPELALELSKNHEVKKLKKQDTKNE